jgi:8-oxo-dGTP pyrophosphatase MutT (NUDIX family)
MVRNALIKNLEQYQKGPFITVQEQEMFPLFIDFVKKNPRCFERDNLGHVTGSAWIVNSALTHALLTHHKKLDLWLQLGGHADGDPDIKAVALKEADEESGIEGLQLLIDSIYDIDIHPIPGKCLFHYDIRYLIRAPENAIYLVSDESHDLAWVSLDQIEQYSEERSVLRMAGKVDLIGNLLLKKT